MNQINTSNMHAKVLIMAGGTGGHIFPALTIAQELLARGTSVEWLGTRNGLEAKIIGATAIPLHFISIGGLRGKGVLSLLIAPFAILRAVIQAVRTISRIKPGCVLGMGGFVTGPGGIAARLLGLKLLIHEQNAIAGLSNQLLFPFAHIVMEAFPGAFRRKQQLSGGFISKLASPRKIRHVGNPVRAEILTLPGIDTRFEQRTGPLRVLVLGGSLGAVAINKMVPQLLTILAGSVQLQVRHQCGVKNLDATRLFYQNENIALNDDVQLLPFIEDMAEAYTWADVLVCRSGASTIAEIAVVGIPAILVPYPFAVDDHQTANAKVLESAGAAWILPQTELSAEAVSRILLALDKNRMLLLQHARAAQSVAVRDASVRAADFCQEACNG